MALNNLPVLLTGYRLMVTEPVTMKTRRENGVEVPVTNRDGEPQYVVVVFAKPRPRPDGSKTGKGEEIRVSLPAEPAEQFDEGDVIELVNPTVSFYEITDVGTGRKSAGLSYRAESLCPVGVRAVAA